MTAVLLPARRRSGSGAFHEHAKALRTNVVKITWLVDCSRDQNRVDMIAVDAKIFGRYARSERDCRFTGPGADLPDFLDWRRRSRRFAGCDNDVHMANPRPEGRPDQVVKCDFSLFLERNAAEIQSVPAAFGSDFGDLQRFKLLSSINSFVDSGIVGPISIHVAIAIDLQLRQNRKGAGARHAQKINSKPKRRKGFPHLFDDWQELLNAKVMIDEKTPRRALGQADLNVATRLFKVKHMNDREHDRS